MNQIGKMALPAIGLMAALLMGCSGTGNNYAFSPDNVMDEILTCDLEDFSDALDGDVLRDWRKPGGDGIEVSTVEDDMDVSYSFTEETGSTDSDRTDLLEFMKTINVAQIPGKVLSIRINEGYNASTKTIGRQTVSYFVTETPNDPDTTDLASEPSMQIDEEEAIELMNESGCLQRVRQLETSPLEFFVNAYIEHESSSYTNDDWGYYERVAPNNNDVT